MSNIDIFAERIEALVREGQVLEAHKAISRHMAKQKLPLKIFGIWMEIAEATGCTPLAAIKTAMKRAPLSPADKAVLDSYLFVDAWVRFDTQMLQLLMTQHQDFTLAEDGDITVRICRIYFKFCIRLLNYRLQNPEEYSSGFDEQLVFIGESHALVPAGKVFPWRGKSVQASTAPIRGIKMFHLGNAAPPKWKPYFREKLATLPDGCGIVLAIGEIDCRPDEGVFPTAHQMGLSPAALLDKTVREFVAAASAEFGKLDKKLSGVTLMGTPFPVYTTEGRLPANTTHAEFMQFVAGANGVMRDHALQAGWDFLDVHTATSENAKAADSPLRIDETHLSPAFYDQANRWLVSSQLND
ncbi:MAG: hypothetical protein EXR08_06995 [Alphaproteobacteria bacterium]|nr:hypothetical protein [Alphaproteobacteria bacterium]